MEWFDVEDNGDDVQFQPEAGAKVGCLVIIKRLALGADQNPGK